MDKFMMACDMANRFLTPLLLLIALGIYIYNAHKAVKAPALLQEERFVKIESEQKRQSDEIKQINEKLTRDYDRMNEFEKLSRMLLKAQYALINHALDGNNTDDLKEVKQEIKDRIFEKENV